MSRIGRLPVPVPSGVDVSIDGQAVTVKGPKGQLQHLVAQPILVARSAVLARRIERYGLRLQEGRDFDLVNPEGDARYREYWTEYHRLTERRGVSASYAKLEMRRRSALIGAMMIHKGEADGMICGTIGPHAVHLQFVDQVIGKRTGVENFYAMNVVMLPKRTLFICDTYVNVDPTPEQIFEMTSLATELRPKAAL